MAEDPGTATYSVRLRDGEHWTKPSWVLRRVVGGAGPTDELLCHDGEWRPSSMLAETERGELPGTLKQLDDYLAPGMASRVQRRYREAQPAVVRQQAGDFTLRLVRDQPSTARAPLDEEARAEVVAFLTEAPLVTGGFRTDGMWVWSESIATTVLVTGLMPDGLFLHHIEVRRFLHPDAVEPWVIERARHLLAVAVTVDESEPVQEPNVPGQAPEPTQEQRLSDLRAWHAEWTRKHEATTPFRPQENEGVEDYNVHYVDLEASKEAQREYDRRAREILGQDPETGRRFDI